MRGLCSVEHVHVERLFGLGGNGGGGSFNFVLRFTNCSNDLCSISKLVSFVSLIASHDKKLFSASSS